MDLFVFLVEKLTTEELSLEELCWELQTDLHVHHMQLTQSHASFQINIRVADNYFPQTKEMHQICT